MQLLRIIKDSEGITQDSLRFKTGFSKSKVSVLIIELEKNDIVQNALTQSSQFSKIY